MSGAATVYVDLGVPYAQLAAERGDRVLAIAPDGSAVDVGPDDHVLTDVRPSICRT